MATAGAEIEELTENQSDLSPRAVAKSSPETTTLWDDPARVREVTRPPHSPSPLRAVTAIDSRGPSCGHAASTALTGTLAVQVWLGLHAPGTHTESPVSGTAGKAPPAV